MKFVERDGTSELSESTLGNETLSPYASTAQFSEGGLDPADIDPDEERRKLQRKYDLALRSDYNENQCWSQDARRKLRNISVRLLGATIIAGIVFFAISELWSYMLSTVEIVFRLAPNHDENEDELETVLIKSSFLKEVKHVESAFTSYSLANLVLIVAAIYALFTFRSPFSGRVLRLSLSVFFMLIATALMIFGPLLALIARNEGSEKHLLKNNEHVAFQEGVKGTVDYFNNGQCKNIDSSVSGKNKTDANEMRVFCDMILRFKIMGCVMLGTSIVPVVAMIICILEIFANRKEWISKRRRLYKERTQEQIEADRCTID